MHLKDLIGTYCYIDCENAEQVKDVCDKLTELGSRFDSNGTIEQHAVCVAIRDNNTHEDFYFHGICPFVRYSFSDLSDFKASTHPQETVEGC